MAEFSWSLTETDKKIAELKQEYYTLVEKEKLAKLREQFDTSYTNEDKNPKIFIYTPTYNRDFILKERALKSVLEQTYGNFEYLVMGDGCSDDTEKIVRNCGDERVKFFNVPQRAWRYPPSAENHWLVGPVMAANTALAMADGKWIARIDDDDYWVPDHLENMLQVAQQGNWEFVSGYDKTIRDGVEAINEATPLYGDYFKIPYPDNNTEIYNPLIGSTSSIFYRSYLRYFEYNIDCWRKPYNRVNDIDLYVRFGLAGVRMGCSKRVEFDNIPRPGETTIGSEAYKRNAEKMEEHFEF